MDWILYVVAAVFCLLGAACLLLVVIQLPGGWVMLGLAGLIEYLDQYYLAAEDQPTFGWWVLGGSLGLLVIGEVIEFVAGALGAKKGGSTRQGMWGALIGGIVGAFALTPILFFIPIFGTLVGAILGTFLGAIIGELAAQQATVKGSVKPAFGATIGRVVGTAGKLVITIAVWLTLSIAAFV